MAQSVTQAARDGGAEIAGMEKRRSTEQRNTVTMGVTATQDSTSEWREVGPHVKTDLVTQDFMYGVVPSDHPTALSGAVGQRE